MADQSGASVDRIAPEDAAALLEAGDAVIVDVREPAEIAATGKAAGALEIPLGAIAARADPAAPDHDPALDGRQDGHPLLRLRQALRECRAEAEAAGLSRKS